MTASAPHVLVVTSGSSESAAVVPVLAACEAAGMRVRAIDLGPIGGGGGLPDRVRRALMGESAERRLRKEIDANPPDVALAFDPFATAALTIARDQATNPAPVVAVVGDLDPGKAWGETNADRLLTIDDEAAVALEEVGVEGDRILVVGPLGERAFADAASEARAALAQRFGLATRAVVIEVAGMGAELTGQLALQLSLSEVSERLTFLFDAAGDAEAAAVLRRQVPILGLRAKLFGATADTARTWRAGDLIVARPRARAIARAMLIGGRLIALVDDEVDGAARIAGILEARGRGIAARGALLVSSAIEAGLRAPPLTPAVDGADQVVEVLWAVATDRRAVIEEHRAEARAATHERLRTATTAASAAAKTVAVPGELEDLGGAPPPPPPPAVADLDALRAEAAARKVELVRSVDAARRAGDAATAAGDTVRAASERSAMHRLLAELATLDRELVDLDAAAIAARAAAATASTAPPPSRPQAPRPTASPPRDSLADLKMKAARAKVASVDDELAALKRKMAESKK